MPIPKYAPDPYVALLVNAPLVGGGGGGAWRDGKCLELLVGETVTLGAPNVDTLPTFTVQRAPSGSSATFSTASITIDTPGLFVFRATFANGRSSTLTAFAFPSDTLSHPAFQYFMAGAHAAVFAPGMTGNTVISGDQRPAPARRAMLMAIAQDEGVRASLGAAVEANPTITAAATFAGFNVAPWATTTP